MSINYLKKAADAAIQYADIPSASVQLKFLVNLPAGVYDFSCPSSVNTTFLLADSLNEEIDTITTVSGALNYHLTEYAKYAYVTINTGTDERISIERVGSVITGPTASLESITATGNYTQNVTEEAWVLGIGGGGGGGAFSGTSYNGYGAAGGGGSGYPGFYRGVLSASTYAVSIGSGGTGVSGSATFQGGSGGVTSFGNLMSASGGLGGFSDGSEATAAVGSDRGRGGGGGSGGGGAGAWNGGGGAGGFHGNSGSTGANKGGGAGSGVSLVPYQLSSVGGVAGAYAGNGGRGGGFYGGGGGANGPADGGANNGTNATDYGGGGGAGSAAGFPNNGGDGAAGIIYILRWE